MEGSRLNRNGDLLFANSSSGLVSLGHFHSADGSLIFDLDSVVGFKTENFKKLSFRILDAAFVSHLRIVEASVGLDIGVLAQNLASGIRASLGRGVCKGHQKGNSSNKQLHNLPN